MSRYANLVRRLLEAELDAANADAERLAKAIELRHPALRSAEEILSLVAHRSRVEIEAEP